MLLVFVCYCRTCPEVSSSSKSLRGSLSFFFFSLSPFNSFFLTLHIHSYNGCLASGDKGRRRSRLALSRRPHANGVKPDVMHHISTPLVSKASSLSQ